MVASTNTTDLSYIKETVPGETPATPTFQSLPVVSNSLIEDITTEVSAAIRPDRQTDDLIPVDGDITGDVGYEVTYTAYKPLLISLLQGVPDINAAVTTVRNGAEVPDSYTFRKEVNVAGTPYLFYYRGIQIGEASMNFETGAILSGDLSLIGLSGDGTATPIPGESVDPPASYALLNSVTSITDISVGGLPVSTEFSTLSLNINNNINPAKAIGTLGAFDLASFTLEVTGDIEIYFEDLSAYNAFKNATSFSVSVTLVDSDNNQLKVTMPKCKFESLSEPVDGKDEFMFQTGTFRALRDETDDYMIEFEFTDAP